MTNIATPMTLVSQDSVASTAKIEQFISEYRMRVQKTATAILELANVVYSASTNLSKSEFESFRNAIGADKSKDSYIKKLICIAHQSARFNAISDKLPPNYTTLYSLSQLSDKEFQKIYLEDVISPQMTAMTLLQHKKMKTVVKKAKFKSINQCVTFTLDLQNIDRVTAEKIIRSLGEVCKEFNIYYECEIDPNRAFQQTDAQDSYYTKKIAA
jgi:hypothetical protein